MGHHLALKCPFLMLFHFFWLEFGKLFFVLVLGLSVECSRNYCFSLQFQTCFAWFGLLFCLGFNPMFLTCSFYCRDQNYSGSGKMFPGINFWKITDFFCGRDGPCLELIIVSSNFQALLLLQDKLLESVWKRLIPVKRSWKLLDPPFSELIQ